MTDVQPTQAAAPAAPENFPLAIAVGLGVAIVGAGIWTAVTVITQLELGIMAVAVGYAVGRAIKAVGHGRSEKFGILGAACSLLACVIGNLLSALIFFSQQTHVPVMTVLSGSSPESLFSLMKNFTQVLDFLFYGIAIYEGFRFSFDRQPG
jgi:hypothetical protein